MTTPATAPEITTAAKDYLADLDVIVPRNGDELRAVGRERGWVEAVKHFANLGLLTKDGLEEAWKILASGGDWLQELRTDDEPVETPPVLPPDAPLWRVAEAHCLINKDFTADFLATAWYKIAPLPTGQWAVQFGAWCQGVGTADKMWTVMDSQAECVSAFLTDVIGLLERPLTRPLDRVQELARRKLLDKLRAHGEGLSA